MVKIIFFGSDKYSVIVLNKLLDEKKFKLVGIVTHPGSPLEELAKTLFAVKFISVKRFAQATCQKIKKLKADIGILASYGKILPKKVLEIPKKGILNIHPSLLPKYRGASPVQFALMKGEKETGVTIFVMDEKVDHGPIIAQFKEEIRNDDTQESLYQRLFQAGAEVLVAILPAWVEGRIKARPQDETKATYAPKLTRQDGKIDWKKSDEEIERFIRAMHPWPGSWTYVHLNEKRKTKNEKRLKILKAHLAQSIPDRPLIPIGDRDRLVFDLVQLEGKKPITWKQFLAGHPAYQFS